MFPSFLTRAAAAALDVADAMLAPWPGGDAHAHGAAPEAQGAMAPHPHRRPLRQSQLAGARRPGALPRGAQPCTTPLARPGTTHPSPSRATAQAPR